MGGWWLPGPVVINCRTQMKLSLFLFLCLASCPTSWSFPSVEVGSFTTWALSASMRPPLDGANTPRREFVQSVIAATALLPQITRAEEDGLVSRERIADLLHVVPTFTIVDPRGVPYMVVGEDAKVTGYFFTGTWVPP